MKRSTLDTPMMRQYLAIKSQHPDALVFYRMGDFYEMFLRDAEVAAPALDIALTTRDRGKDHPVPMCGVPVHSADPHIKRLAELGHRVAICEQVEDAKATSGRRLVRRGVVEVITPGLVGDPEGIEAGRELAVVAIDPGAKAVGLAVLDASTGDFRAAQVEAEGGAAALPPALLEELERVGPREILLPAPVDPALEALLAARLPGASRTAVDAASFDPGSAPDRLPELARTAKAAAARAAAALLAYLETNQPFALVHLSRLRCYELADTMILDAATRSHLELFRNMDDGSRAGTLLEQLDRTTTPLGARRLARWIAYPLVDPASIVARQEAVAFLAERDRPRARLRESLRPVRDLERLLAKAARPTAAPRDLSALGASLDALPAVAGAFADPGDGGCPRRATGGRTRSASRSRCRKRPIFCARRWSTIPRWWRAAPGARARPATSATAFAPSWTGCGGACARVASGSPAWRRGSARAPAWRTSRSAITPSMAMPSS